VTTIISRGIKVPLKKFSKRLFSELGVRHESKKMFKKKVY
jgi:hypothetical protein